MRKYLLSSVALLGFTAAAAAADLPVRSAPPPMIPAVPIFTWTGFYVGLNAGWGWQDNGDESVFVPAGTFLPPFAGVSGVLTRGDSGNEDGFVGGGQIGYNYQIGSFVIGVEADIQWADFGGGDEAVAFLPAGFPPTFVPAIGAGRGGFDWFGTVRARAGVAFDRLLVYATGGFAYAGGGDDNGNCGFIVGVGGGFCDSGDDTRTGWTVGGGIEWALPVNWFGSSAVTFGLEGLWVSLDSESNNNGFVGTYIAPGGVLTPVFVAGNNDDDNDFAVFRARLNFKF
jgi:outer membrane immunogenic protein